MSDLLDFSLTHTDQLYLQMQDVIARRIRIGFLDHSAAVQVLPRVVAILAAVCMHFVHVR